MSKAVEKGHCPLCRNSGWVITIENDVEKVKPCPDCTTASRARNLLVKAGIPPRFAETAFDTYKPHPEHPSQTKALTRAMDYVEAFPRNRGLLFVGPPGVGKTHLSVAILRALIAGKGVQGMFVDEAELLRRLQYSYTPDSPETEQEVMRPLMRVDLVVWDDLGTGRPTEWVSETIRTILNHRYTHNRQTVLSTNLPLKPIGTPSGTRSSHYTLEERLSRPLYSRLREMCEQVEISGPDHRDDKAEARIASKAPQRHASAEIKIPRGLLRCPACNSPRIEPDKQSAGGPPASGSALLLSSRCEACGHAFVARFHPRTAKVEYL